MTFSKDQKPVPLDGSEPSLALSDLISKYSGQLTDADTRLLDVLVRDPLRGAIENGKDVSFRAGVHPASAVRLARRLGFKGYPEFRTFLRTSLTEGGSDFESSAARIAARVMKADGGGMLSSVIDSEIAALKTLRDTVSDPDIRRFSEALRDARRILVFGRGHASALGSLIALRLARSGYDAIDLGSRMHQLPEVLSALGDTDVVWMLAFRKVPSIIEDVMRAAGTRGAKTLALTDLQGARIDPAPLHQILVSRGPPGESQSLVVPMTVANAVILDLAGIDNGKSIRALAEFREFRIKSGLSAAAI
jgi:DNA-binding MurR/RpiR family transcriptional regulator